MPKEELFTGRIIYVQVYHLDTYHTNQEYIFYNKKG
jgi:hypothetical protein